MRIFLFVITIIIMAALPNCNGKKTEVVSPVQKDLDSLVDLKTLILELTKSNRIETKSLGFEGLSSQWTKYEKLKKIATKEELLALTEAQNPVVRCYAFQALASRGLNEVFSILIDHLNDTTTVKVYNGCILMNKFVGDYFINIVYPYSNEQGNYKLSLDQKEVVDSILINDKSCMLFSKILILRNLNPKESNYKRIKELVEKDGNLSALIALAKFKKQDDKKLIAKFFKDRKYQYDALCAVKEFPDNYFYSYVAEVFEQQWRQELFDYSKWKICYQTLAKFPREETLEFFERTINLKNEFRYNILCKYLLIAITKYPNDAYEKYKMKIKLNDYYMTEVKNEISIKE